MTVADKKIVKMYDAIFDNLSPGAKIGLIESLTKSLKNDIQKDGKKKNFKSTGNFILEKTAEEIITGIKGTHENTQSAKSEKERRKKFLATFGAFKDDASTEVFDNLKSHRKFRKKDVSF